MLLGHDCYMAPLEDLPELRKLRLALPTSGGDAGTFAAPWSSVGGAAPSHPLGFVYDLAWSLATTSTISITLVPVSSTQVACVSEIMQLDAGRGGVELPCLEKK